MGASRLGAVVQVNHAVAEAALAEELEPQVAADREGLFAAAHHSWHDEQMTLSAACQISA